MAFSDFTLDTLRRSFGLTQMREPLFPSLLPLNPTLWLLETLTLSQQLIIDSEKARSELIVMPILLTARQLMQNHFAIYSGHSLTGDKDKGLIGECDFILTHTAPLPALQAPIVTLVEAKKEDIDGWLGQCAAQMLGARLFNQQDHLPIETIFGCVTTGEAWQFLKLEGQTIYVDQNRYYINQLPEILGVLKAIIDYYDGQP